MVRKQAFKDTDDRTCVRERGQEASHGKEGACASCRYSGVAWLDVFFILRTHNTSPILGWLGCNETQTHVAFWLSFDLPWTMASRKLCKVKEEESGVSIIRFC